MGNGDEPHPPRIDPIDGRVVAVTTERGQIRIGIAISNEIRPGTVTYAWTGAFTDGEKVISGTDFKLTQAYANVLATRIAGPKPPSMSVRLFPPGYPR